MIKLKTKPEYFQAIIEGRKPFEIRKNDRGFAVGDEIKLVEFTSGDYHQKCKLYKDGCVVWEEVPDENLRWDFGQDEALEECGKKRLRCCAYTENKYTGRECDIKIKEIFNLKNAGLPEYVVFTFDILSVRDLITPYTQIVDKEESYY